jgi:hypothetical protein
MAIYEYIKVENQMKSITEYRDFGRWRLGEQIATETGGCKRMKEQDKRKKIFQYLIF